MTLYPSTEDIISVNEEVLKEIKVRKADAHKVLSRVKIDKVLESVKCSKGDLYDKAAVMLKDLIQAHPFASGNRRTAFVVVQNFLLYNSEKPKVNKDSNARIMQGIREGYYTHDEIKNWLEGGDIREFKR